MNAKKILIIGGGIAGMCAAIELRKRNAQVDLVELDPHWRVYGAGITLSGPTLRAFTEIGVIDAIMERGWCADGANSANSSDRRPCGKGRAADRDAREAACPCKRQTSTRQSSKGSG